MRSLGPPLKLLLVSALLCGTPSCASVRMQPRIEPALVTVNGQVLSTDEFDRFVSVKLGDFAEEPLNDRVRSELFDEFVKRQITVQAAEQRGLKIDTPVVEESKEKMLLYEQALDSVVDRYYREVVLSNVEVTPDEVLRYYNANRDRYANREGFSVREIRVKTRDEAERARQSILSGCADFPEVARTVSQGPAAAKGGLTFYETGTLPREFEQVVTSLAVGQMSEIIQSKLGYHIFLLERRGSVQPLERVRERVIDDVRARKNERLVEADVERLVGQARVEINRDSLPFHYEGRFPGTK